MWKDIQRNVRNIEPCHPVFNVKNICILRIFWGMWKLFVPIVSGRGPSCWQFGHYLTISLSSTDYLTMFHRPSALTNLYYIIWYMTSGNIKCDNISGHIIWSLEGWYNASTLFIELWISKLFPESLETFYIRWNFQQRQRIWIQFMPFHRGVKSVWARHVFYQTQTACRAKRRQLFESPTCENCVIFKGRYSWEKNDIIEYWRENSGTLSFMENLNFTTYHRCTGGQTGSLIPQIGNFSCMDFLRFVPLMEKKKYHPIPGASV